MDQSSMPKHYMKQGRGGKGSKGVRGLRWAARRISIFLLYLKANMTTLYSVLQHV